PHRRRHPFPTRRSSDLALPGKTPRTIGEVGRHLGRGILGIQGREQPALILFAVHDLPLSIWGARTSMSFCRALKTRQRAVSSVRSEEHTSELQSLRHLV